MVAKPRCDLTVGAELARLRLHTCMGEMVRALGDAYTVWRSDGMPIAEARNRLWTEARKAAERHLNRPVTQSAATEIVMLAQQWAEDREASPDEPYPTCGNCALRSGA